MKRYIRKQLKSFKHQWKEYPKTRLKLVWMAFLIWFLFAPVMYTLLFFVGLLTLNNPHRFASDALNEMF